MLSNTKLFLNALKDFNDGGEFENFIWSQKANAALFNPVFRDSVKSSIDVIRRSSVTFRNERYLADFKPDLGVTLIRSPKNTGKTTSLEPYLRQAELRVLFIGHRISLVKKASQQFNLAFYDDGMRDQRRLAITLDSVWKVQRHWQYDIIVVDESEQLLSHFFSKTMASRQNSCVRALDFLVQRAKQVVVLDADLSWPSLNFFGKPRQSGGVSVIVNEFVDKPDKNLVIHANLFSINSEIIEASLKDRIFVVSDQKRYLNSLKKKIVKGGKDTKRILSINSSTRKTGPVVNFLKDPGACVHLYDVILASPTISSGIDISFASVDPVFTRVFGVFHGLDFTHFECDQQLGRVRIPGQVDVWVGASTSRSQLRYLDSYEIASEEADWQIAGRHRYTIEEDILHQVADATRNVTLIDFGNGNVEQRDTEHPFEGIARSVIPARYFSRLHLKHNFIEFKEDQGWNIVEIPPLYPTGSLREPAELYQAVLDASADSDGSIDAEGADLLAAEISAMLTAAGVLKDGRLLKQEFSMIDLSAFVDLHNKKSDILINYIRTSKSINLERSVTSIKKVLSLIGVDVKSRNTNRNGKPIILYFII